MQVQSASPPSFPSGTSLPCFNTAAPTGWTKDTGAAYNDAGVKLVTGTPTTGGSVVFSTVFGITATGSTILTAAQIPDNSIPQSNTPTTGAAGRAQAGHTGSASSGHTHPLDLQLKFVEQIKINKT